MSEPPHPESESRSRKTGRQYSKADSEPLQESSTAPPAGQRRSPDLVSPSVRTATEHVGPRDVTCSTLAAAILRLHPEYGGGRGKSFLLEEPPGSTLRTAESWLSDVRSLYDVDKVPTLHGRVVVVGLALLDTALRQPLDQDGFLDALIGELREPLETVLTPRGTTLWRQRENPPDEEPSVSRDAEETPTHTDNPALVDELGRKGFAKVLARRITDLRAEESRNARLLKGRKTRGGGSFLVHLHAPWGAGKTSTLNFLADELRPNGWVVVNFNAWRHQRIVPPWWWLMTAIYSESLRELRTKRTARGEGFLQAQTRALSVSLREWLWRLRGGWPGYLILLLAAVLPVLIWRAGLLRGYQDENVWSLETARGIVVAAAAVVTPALVLWGLVRGAGHWIFATSARGARRYMDNTRDPMRTVQDHVADLIQWIGRDVIILIDDLDRCKGPYVIELLEGVQTLFRDIPVAYVVAADRDWLSDSYAAEYRSFVSAGDEPGRPLGYLFLEKTFQISVTLPPIGGQLQGFWNRLLRSADLPSDQELESARANFASAHADKDINELRDTAKAQARATAETGTAAAVADLQVTLEALAVEEASTRAAEDAAHALSPFRELLDPNPRAMKRLVNAYGITRGSETLRGQNLEHDIVAEQRTALWLILNLRWPKLGDHLARFPRHVDAIGSGQPPPEVASDLRPLFDDPDVVAVVNGEADDVVAHLDAAVIARYTKPWVSQDTKALATAGVTAS